MSVQLSTNKPGRPGISKNVERYIWWSDIIKQSMIYLLLGDRGSGKSCLAYWLLEVFSPEDALGLHPVVVGLDKSKSHLKMHSQKQLISLLDYLEKVFGHLCNHKTLDDPFSTHRL